MLVAVDILVSSVQILWLGITAYGFCFNINLMNLNEIQWICFKKNSLALKANELVRKLMELNEIGFTEFE